jgi:outer membrane immunogenic protein
MACTILILFGERCLIIAFQKKYCVMGAAVIICIAVATPSRAADLELPLIYDWGGSYIGLQAGYGWQPNNSLTLDQVEFGSFQKLSLDDNGAFGGLHAGYNYTNGNFLYGMESDLDRSDIKSDGVHGDLASIDKSVEWLGSLRFRGGMTMDHALIYATGGFAAGDVDMKFTSINGNISGHELALGWTVGVGIEFAASDNLNVNIEYRYTDLANTKNVGDVTGLAPLYLNMKTGFKQRALV